MISKNDLERILAQPPASNKVLSLFLDMSVNSDNKRTHRVFLNQSRAQLEGPGGDRPGHPREPIGRLLQRIDDWLETEFNEENRGAAIYADLEGDWFEALQFPVPIANRLAIEDRPVITPLAQ